MTEGMTIATAAAHVFPNVFLFDGGRYVVATAIFATLALLAMRSRWRVRKLQTRHATASDYRRELLTSLRSVFVYAMLFTPILWLASNGYIGHFEGQASAWAIAAYVVIMLIGHDAWFYWTHRALHTRRLFRKWHRTHHRSITPTPFAAYAFDTREAAVQAGFFILWQLVVPTPTAAFFIVLGISILRNAWGHMGIELHPSWFADHPLTGWLTTTTHHDLHHAGGLNTNFGLYFTWWDRMFRTEHPRYREIFREVTSRRLDAATAEASASVTPG